MKLENIWSVLRTKIRNSFSFAQIKDLVGSCGLPIHRLSNIQQKLSGGASKGQLMDEIDRLFINISEEDREKVVINCIREMCLRDEVLKKELEEMLERFGWGLRGTEPYPLTLLIHIDTADLPEKISTGIDKCLRRFRDKDISGAITTICGTVDSLTEEIYLEYHLGDHKKAPYQERVSNSFSKYEKKYKEPFVLAGISDDEVNLLWNNHKKAVSQAAYVLGAFRRGFSDVHGEKKEIDPRLLQSAIDCAVFITRSIVSLKH